VADKPRPIRLAVIFDQKIQAGGGYQQALNAARLTKKLPEETVETLFFTTLEVNVASLVSEGIQAELIQLSLLVKLRTYIRRIFADAHVFRLIRRLERYSYFERRLIQRKIDLVYFLTPSSWACDLEELNFITTVWDLCHRDHPEFPEVRWGRECEAREKKYWGLLPRATAIFVDSELGARNVVTRYGIDEDRVHVMPFQAAPAVRDTKKQDSLSSIDVREKYNLDAPYVFYPAQFWAHKNHTYLLQGLRVLEARYGLRIAALFSGGDQGNLAYVQSFARKMKLEDRVRFVGFVDNDEICELYQQSVALVMPSYFGPTNLPPIEAFELGVPVLYADKAGLRDQVGDAALLMNLNDPESMAKHLKNLIEDHGLRMRLIAAGRARLRDFDTIDRVEILNRLLGDFQRRRLTWER